MSALCNIIINARPHRVWLNVPLYVTEIQNIAEQPGGRVIVEGSTYLQDGQAIMPKEGMVINCTNSTPGIPYPQEKQMDEIDLYAFANFVAAEGRTRKLDAAHRGGMDDGGGTAIEDMAECFGAGLNNRIPDCMKSFIVPYQRSIDPEYQKYLQLKKKFGG